MLARAARAVWPLCIAALGAACGGSPGGGQAPSAAVSRPTPVSDSSNSTTAAYGVLGTATVRVAFVPSPGGVMPFLLENRGALSITWGGPADGTGLPPTVPLTFAIDACAVSSSEQKAVCIGFASARVAVLDLLRFATSLRVSDIGIVEFDSGAGSVANVYSGGECILCGVVMDAGRPRYVIGGAGGFRVYNFGSQTASAIYDVPVGENFAFLPQSVGASYIIAPEYLPAGGQRKLRVVSMDSGKSYVWDRNTDSAADLGAAGANFLFTEVDAASVDVNTRMIALSTESSADFMLIDFGRATFHESTQSFSAPFEFAKPNPATPVARLTDIAISTAGSILLSHGEGVALVGITQLPAALAGDGTGIGALGVFDLNDAAFDHAPCGAGYVFAGKGDPHGLSLYADLDNGQRGLVIDFSNVCAAILDLARLRDAPRRPNDPNLIDTSLPAVRGMVRFVRLR
ncbi:MAG TPA: hypothetical protein VFQ20_07395 [Burkholderiaceae bacterium]|nr:hypothetical protein [Burkholderiaceae bacterium]